LNKINKNHIKMEEIWKPCKRDPDYDVSNTGKIRNNHGYIHNQKPHATGYIRVHLKESKGKQVPLHVLIAETYIPNPNSYKYVHHIDGDKVNNNVSNLDWVDFPPRKHKKPKKPKNETNTANVIVYDTEIWKDVVFEGHTYKASNYGRIELRSGTITYGSLTADKYMAFNTPSRKSRRVHNVICTAFHGPKPSPAHVVNHIDFNKSNNKPENLEWVTQRENVQHSLPMKKPTIAYNRKKVAQFTIDNAFIKEYNSVSQASKETNVNRSGIQQFLNGKYGFAQFGGFIWKYL
jgi:hypothetical protein